MKRLVLLAVLLVLNTVSYTKIGRHNVQLNVGGGYQGIFKPETHHMQYIPSYGLAIVTQPAYKIGGGAFTVELGYLLHSVRQSGIVHGFDLRADFSMSFINGYVYKGFDGKVLQESERMQGGFAMTYTLGHQFKSGSRLMFDVIGYGSSVRIVESVRKSEYSDPNIPNISVSATSPISLTLKYILPGVQFISKNGLTIGWRNKVEIYLGAQEHEGLYGISTMASLGFTFGSGKQPWEKTQNI